MSTPLTLVVPVPVLTFKAVASAFAPLEGLIKVSFPNVFFPDGSPMTADDFTAGQALLTRTLTATSTGDVWDKAVQTWKPLAGADLAHITGVPLVPPKTAGAPWSGSLLSADQQDAAGAPAIQAAVANFPQYRLRGLFRAKRDGVEAFGLGPQSAALRFAAASDSARFSAVLTPDQDSATRARLLLRSAAGQTVGVLDLDASSGNTVVTIANFDTGGNSLASIVLGADGSIVLTPLAPKKVVIAGDLETERILYRPDNGAAKRPLP